MTTPMSGHGTTTTSTTGAPARRRTAFALPAATAWSLTYLGLGIAWLTGASGNPADPAVDDLGGGQAVLPWLGARPGAWLLTGLAAAGLATTAAMVTTRREEITRSPEREGGHPAHRRALLELPAAVAAVLGLVLAAVIPDYRVLVLVAYSLIAPFLNLFDIGKHLDVADVLPWPVANLTVLTLAGLCWLTAAADHLAVVAPRMPVTGWRMPVAAARWGRWATRVAAAVPVGYAVSRLPITFGVPLGISQEAMDRGGKDLRLGATCMALLALGGAALTLGLVQRWGEVFPRWMPGLGGRRVPVGLAVVPACTVAVIVTSAGLTLARGVLAGDFGTGQQMDLSANLSAWLPTMFWPLWGLALAAAAYAYRLRRGGEDPKAPRPGTRPGQDRDARP